MTTETTERECENPACDVVFVPTRAWQKFHSKECQQGYWAGLRDLASKIAAGKVVVKGAK